MAYKREQLPYIGFKEKAEKAKKAFNRRGGHHPLTIKLTNSDGTLFEITWTYAFDRKPKTEILADKDWDVPINFEIWEDGTFYLSEEIYEVKVRTVRTSGSVQLNIGDYLGEE